MSVFATLERAMSNCMKLLLEICEIYDISALKWRSNFEILMVTT